MQQGVPLHRYLIGLEIILLLLFYWGLINIIDIFKSVFNISANLQMKIITIGLIILTIASTSLANHNVDKYFANKGELIYTKNVIQEYGISKLSNTSTIYIITPSERTPYEFSLHTTAAQDALVSMARLALYELGVNSDIPIKCIGFNEEIVRALPANNNDLVIDMSEKISIRG